MCSLMLSAPKMVSSSSSEPTAFPVMSLTSIFMAMPRVSGLDLDVDAGREVQLHQCVERLLRRLEDVEQALVRANLELLARLLVGVRRAQHRVLVDLGRQRNRTGDLGAGTLRGLHDLARRLVEELVVVRLETDADAWSGHRLSRYFFAGAAAAASFFTATFSARIFVTTPAPTVLPPSRIAKRRPSSQAIGETSSTSILMLSPGITISVPAGNVTVPVTSVVRK